MTSDIHDATVQHQGVAPAAVPILLYHSVTADTGGMIGRYTMAPALFRAHVEWIAGQGFRTLTVSDYVKTLTGEVALPARPLVVTFDDGYADFLDEALPILVEHGIRSTLYVSTRPVGRSRRGTLAGRPMLTWRELSQLHTFGVEIGAHSHDHAQLDLLPRSRVNEQVTTCKRLLEDHLQTRIRSFAYPHGYNSAATRQAVCEAGYSSACAVKNARSHAGDDRWALARIMFEHDDGVEQLGAACVTDAFPLGAPGDTAKSRAWRAVRRTLAAVRPNTLVPPTTSGD